MENGQTGLTEQEAGKMVADHFNKVRKRLDDTCGSDVADAVYGEIQKRGGLSPEQIWGLTTTQKPEVIADAMVDEFVRRNPSETADDAWRKLRAKEKSESVGRAWSVSAKK